MTNYSVKVAMGPGTAGYDVRTPKQRAKTTTWARFVVGQDAHNFADMVRHDHPTWIVTVEYR